MSQTGPARGVLHRRGLLGAALAAYSVFLLWILLWPSAAPAAATVGHVYSALLALGVPDGLVTGSRVEFALNALMLVPEAFLAAVLWRGWSWERWTAYAFVVSSAIELFQGLVLSGRTAQFPDVVANTLGALAGAVLARTVLRLQGGSRRYDAGALGTSSSRSSRSST